MKTQRDEIRQILHGSRLQSKRAIGEPGDKYEQEADRVAEQVMRMPAPQVERQVEQEEEKEDNPVQSKPIAGQLAPLVQRQVEEEAEEEILQTKNVPGQTPSVTPEIAANINAIRGGGRPLPKAARDFFEPRFGYDFSNVRVHTGSQASETSLRVNARAFAIGNDVVFGAGQYAPGTSEGQRLLAHELTHVVQQEDSGERSDGGRVDGAARLRIDATGNTVPDLQRDLAVEPPSIGAVARELTEEEIESAIRYNAFRFKDPFSIAVFRDVIGIRRFPAVSDRDFALAVAQWQAEFNLTVDGRAGPRTTRTLVRVLNAERLPDLGQQLRQDNFISWTHVNARDRTACTAATRGRFRWDVDFRTSLRRGWLIQEMRNAREMFNCGGGTPNTSIVNEPRYWEAWWVDGSGDVSIPTSLTTPPTTTTPAVADDRWFRGIPADTRGTWSIRARLYTTLTLPPAGFGIHNVAEAVDLPSTTTPEPDSDDLGPVEARRNESGEWDCCDPDPANHFHRAT